MEELKKYILKLKESTGTYVLTKEDLINDLTNIYNKSLRENIEESLENDLQNLTYEEIVDLVEELKEIIGTDFDDIHEHDEEFYEEYASSYKYAIEQAINSYNWEESDEYIDEEFTTMTKEEYGETIMNNIYKIARDIIDNYENVKNVIEEIVSTNTIDKIKHYEENKL